MERLYLPRAAYWKEEKTKLTDSTPEKTDFKYDDFKKEMSLIPAER